MRVLSNAMLAGIVATLAGCAHGPRRPQPEAAGPPPVEPQRTKLAVLPVESDLYPDVANSINNSLREVHVKGVDDYFLSKATLEVVQLSIECVEPTSECLVAVGKSLGANKLLVASIAPAGRRKHDKSVRVTVTLFDVDA